MRRPPREPREGIFAGGLGAGIFYQGVIIAVLTLFSYAVGNHDSHMEGMTMAFLTLSMCEIFHSLNMRSRHQSLLRMHTHNKMLYYAMLVSSALTFGVIYLPGINDAFSLVALDPFHVAVATGLALSIIPLVELAKMIESALHLK